MPDVHDEPCLVEAHEREVLVECGTNLFALTPSAATHLAARLEEAAKKAVQQEEPTSV